MYGVNTGDVTNLIGFHGPATITTDTQSAVIDLNDYDGQLVLAALLGASTGNANNTMVISLYECDTSGGSFTISSQPTISAGYNAAAQGKVTINKNALKRYVLINMDVSGTSPSYVTSVALLGAKKNPA